MSGFKPDIDDDDWLVSKATQTITGDGGFTTVPELDMNSSRKSSSGKQYVIVGTVVHSQLKTT